MKYIGIDYGSRKIGIAVSDAGGTIAFPREIIANNKETLGVLVDFVTHEHIEAIVVGDSKDYTGTENAIMEPARRFAGLLEEATRLPLFFQDERLSSVGARRLPMEGKARGETSRKESRYSKHEVDAHAAAIILQAFLDKAR